LKQSGFTLIETLVIIGLSSVITIGAVLTIHQILQNTSLSNSKVVALDDISRVVLQIKRDLQSQQTANLTDLHSAPTIFTWTNLSGFEPIDERDHYSKYTLTGTVLYHEADNVTKILGRHIEALIFTQNEEAIDVEITATSANNPPRSETFSFSMYGRSDNIDE